MLIFQLFLQISENCFQKMIVQYYYLKDCSSIFKENQTVFVNINKKTSVPILAIFGTFRNSPKMMV